MQGPRAGGRGLALPPGGREAPACVLTPEEVSRQTKGSVQPALRGEVLGHPKGRCLEGRTGALVVQRGQAIARLNCDHLSISGTRI